MDIIDEYVCGESMSMRIDEETIEGEYHGRSFLKAISI